MVCCDRLSRTPQAHSWLHCCSSTPISSSPQTPSRLQRCLHAIISWRHLRCAHVHKHAITYFCFVFPDLNQPHNPSTSCFQCHASGCMHQIWCRRRLISVRKQANTVSTNVQASVGLYSKSLMTMCCCCCCSGGGGVCVCVCVCVCVGGGDGVCSDLEGSLLCVCLQ